MWLISQYLQSSTPPPTPSPSVTQAVTLPDHWELGYPDGPEMKDYKLQLRQFVSEWEEMESALTADYSVLEIDGKSPEDLLQEIVLHMESKCVHSQCINYIK